MADNNRCHGRCHVSENRELVLFTLERLDKEIKDTYVCINISSRSVSTEEQW